MAEMLETDAQDVDERAPPQFAPRAMDVFASKCHHRTRFLLCDHDVPELRPTALHFAVLLGHEELIKALVQASARARERERTRLPALSFSLSSLGVCSLSL